MADSCLSRNWALSRGSVRLLHVVQEGSAAGAVGREEATRIAAGRAARSSAARAKAAYRRPGCSRVAKERLTLCSMLVYAGLILAGAPLILAAAMLPFWTNCSLLELPRMRARATGLVVGQADGCEGPAPIVAFDLAGEGTFRFTHDWPPMRKVREVGDTVEVRYMPRDPRRARIASGWAVAAHVLVFVFAVAGLLLIADGVALN